MLCSESSDSSGGVVPTWSVLLWSTDHGGEENTQTPNTHKEYFPIRTFSCQVPLNSIYYLADGFRKVILNAKSGLCRLSKLFELNTIMLDVYPELDVFFGICRTSEITQYDINDNNLWSKDLGTSENQMGSYLVAETKLKQLEPKTAKLFCRSLATNEHAQFSKHYWS